ncbi:hypothetical protein MHU86_6927 [Fragilaria crotonensis]|nr:hypothetical protein MHU86_6927 [Fragilaria crotonensis]
MDRIIALRNDALEGEIYMDLLDDLLKTVVGATKFKENRCEKHLSGSLSQMRHSSSCVLKITGNNGITNGWLTEMDRLPTNLHLKSLTHGTRAKQGTKRSWSREGMERFNNLAVLVYNDRRGKGRRVRSVVPSGNDKSYGDRNRDAGRENIEAEVVNAAPTIVYNEFNMQLLIAHAQHQQLQPPAPEDDVDRVQEAV